MLLTEDIGMGDYQIRAYDTHSITINDIQYTSSLIVSSHQLIPDWPLKSIDALAPEYLEVIWTLNPEIVLLGTGEKFILPLTQQLIPFYEKRIGIECMSIGAACRTYTALLSEGRKVAAALIIG